MQAPQVTVQVTVQVLMLGTGWKKTWIIANQEYKQKLLISWYLCQYAVKEVGISLIQEHTVMGSEFVPCDLEHWQR